MKWAYLGASLALSVPLPALAGDLDLRVLDGAGRPVPDAVVTVNPASGVPRLPAAFPGGNTMVQQNIAFAPHVLIVPVGATVSFPNKDKVRHHVYSFSKPAKFEIKLFARDETRSYRFVSAGAVALGCNIHDSMSGFIKVVDTPFAAKSSADGRVRIAGLPAGAAQVTVWHPEARARDNETVLTVSFSATGAVARAVTLTLR
jgi:plastocyanin